MYQEIVVIEDGNELVQRLEKIFKNEKDYIYNSINSENLEEKIKTIPDLIIINEDNIKNNIIDICDFIRKESENSITPIVVVSSDINKEHRIEILKSSVEYFIKVPIDEDYFYYTIKFRIYQGIL